MIANDKNFKVIRNKGLCPFESPNRFFLKEWGDEGFPLIKFAVIRDIRLVSLNGRCALRFILRRIVVVSFFSPSTYEPTLVSLTSVFVFVACWKGDGAFQPGVGYIFHYP